MVTVGNLFSTLLLIFVCLTCFFSGSDTVFRTGIVSSKCSSFSWANSTIEPVMTLYQDMPLPIEIALLDILCENPACTQKYTNCQIGNCSTCVPIIVDYTGRISFSVEYVEGIGSRPLDGHVNCSVGSQIATKPGFYPAECTAANHMIVAGDFYFLVMTVMSIDNNTKVLAKIRHYVIFSAGNPVVENTWADFENPPLAIHRKNNLRLWLKDRLHNPVSAISGVFGVYPIAFTVVVTTTSGEPATLQIPPEADCYNTHGYYLAPITPIHTGHYIATITVGSVHISNSPLSFTVGEKFGIPARNASSSPPIILAGLLLRLLVGFSTVLTVPSLLQGCRMG